MSKQELIDFFIRNGDILVHNGIATGALRTFGFWLLKLLVSIADACKELYDITFGLVDFTTWPKINTFIEQFRPLFVALMAVSIFALGIMLIFNHEKKPKILMNICIACLCVTCSTVVFQQLNTIVKDVKTGIDTVAEAEQGNDVYDIVGNNLIDIYYLDQKIGLSNIDYEKNADKLPHPKMSKKKLAVMDYTQVLNVDDEYYKFQDDNAEDILTQMIHPTGEGDLYDLVEMYDGFAWTSVGNNLYYRYHLNGIPVVLELLAVTILYIALSYKCTRLAFELVFARLLAYLYSAELSGGQKVAKILTFIRDTYILLLVTTLCIKIFYFFNAYITSSIDNTLVQAFIILFIAFSVIDGPNLVEKLLGMDAGLKSSTARMLSAYHIASKAAHTAMSPARMAARHGMNQYMANRQANATRDAIQNAMHGTGSEVGEGKEGFMNGSEKSFGNNSQEQKPSTGSSESRQGANGDTNEHSDESRRKDSSFGDTGFMEDDKPDEANSWAKESDEATSPNSDFMDREPQNDDIRDSVRDVDTGASAAFMDKGSEPAHVNEPAGSGNGMSNKEAASQSSSAHYKAQTGLSKETSGISFMEEEAKEKKQSSMKPVDTKYEGKIFKNMNEKEDKA